jgi:hypothetical protein
MNRKSLRLLLLLGVWCLASLARTTHAAGIIGYANIYMNQGFSLINNPFYGSSSSDSNLNTFMSGAPDGAVIHRFNPSTQSYTEGINFFSGVGWRTASGDPNDPALLIAPGEAYWIESPRAWTTTVVGLVNLGTNINPILANYNLKADVIPASGLLQTTLSFPAQIGDTVWKWTNSALSAFSYDGSTPWVTNEPSIVAGEGFIVWRNPALATPANYWKVILNPGPVSPPPPSAGNLAGARPTEVEIQGLTIRDGVVCLQINNQGGDPYTVLFSSDGVSWTTVGANQTAQEWKAPYPGGARGFYKAVQP